MTRGPGLRGLVVLLMIATALYAGAIALSFTTSVGILLVAAGMLLLPLALLVVRRRVFLARRGTDVTEAGDGVQALERLAGLDPHVILADLRMPKMDGAELYTRLQAERPALAERVLFLSGDITQLAGRGLAPVARERVLVKPVELAELERRIQEFIREAAAG